MSRGALADEKKVLGNEEFNNKNYEKSIEYYTQAIEIDGNNHVYYSNRSAAYGAVGDWERAEKDGKKCIELNPNFAKGYHRLAVAQKSLGKLNDAMQTLKLGKEKDTKNSEIIRLIGVVQKEMQAKQVVIPEHVAKELNELQPQINQVQRELEQIQSKLVLNSREKKRLHLTHEDLKQLPAGTNTYRSIGKMFLEMKVSECESHLDSQITKIDDQVASLEARKEYLERQKVSYDETISELLAQCRA